MIQFSFNTNTGVSTRVHKLSAQPPKRAPTSCASHESQGGTSDRLHSGGSHNSFSLNHSPERRTKLRKALYLL